MTDQINRGGCLCGAVRFGVTGPLRDVIYCHCEQCRRTSGHFVAATACSVDDLVMQEDRGLRWYTSSDEASRGFCGECGASLFWQERGHDTISIMAGSLDLPTHLSESHHIFVANAGDYYSLNDGLPQSPQDTGKDNRGLTSDDK